MRKKTPKIVLTFASTSDALAMESSARKHQAPGRIIPVPGEIDAGCGLAWCAEAAEKPLLMAHVEAHGIAYEGAFEALLY